MKQYELQPTEDNILKTLEGDWLNRNRDLFRFIDMLQSPLSPEIIALDGKWGCGKTFFVKQMMMIMNSFNKFSNYNQDLRDKIKKIIDEKNEIKNDYLVVYYDAWKNDSYQDPIVSIIYEISKQLSINFQIEDNITPYKVAASIIENISKVNINSIVDSLKSDDPLSSFKQQVEIEKQFKQFFTDVLIERGNKLIVVIDELDRCNPCFAVKLLEQLKHYVDDERVLFVVSTNLDELQHTVKHYYGESFDACKYLNKFFSITVKMPPIDKEKYYSKIGLNTNYTVENNCKIIINEYHMELREIAYFLSQVEIAVYNPTHGRKEAVFPDGKAEEINLLYIAPLIIGLNIVDKDLCNDFVNGKNYSPLLRLIEIKDNGEFLLNSFLEHNETFIEQDDKKKVTREELVKRWYNAIFVKEYTGSDYYTNIGGKYEFTSDSKKSLLSAAGLLSNYANYK